LYIRDDFGERTNVLALAAASTGIGFLAGIVVCLGVLINERVIKSTILPHTHGRADLNDMRALLRK
jgi:hypothetical protein